MCSSDLARLVNCARGGIVDEADLADALQQGVIAGAALDVFATEPLAKDSPLRQVKDRLILTPHLGASTEEAQENVAIDVAEQIRDVLLGLPARSAVNIPGLTPELLNQLKPHLHLAETLGQLLSQLGGGQISELEVRLQGDFAGLECQPLVVAALKAACDKAGVADLKKVSPVAAAKIITSYVWGQIQVVSNTINRTTKSGELPAVRLSKGDVFTGNDLGGVLVQSPQSTLEAGRGTEYDTCALLTAMLKKAGIPAHPVVGYDRGSSSGGMKSNLGSKSKNESRGTRCWVEIGRAHV